MSNTSNYIDKLFKSNKVTCMEFVGACQTCNKEVSIVVFKDRPEETEGTGGMVACNDNTQAPLFKCTECLAKDNGMISPTRTEVFGRVCGYLRPVKAFNPGKKAEWKARTNYNIKEDGE